jgi:F-type H+-transporting ATPase subunit delta
MAELRIAVRYALSIIEIGQEHKNLDSIKSDFELIKSVLEGSRELFNLLKSPIIKADQKIKVFESIFQNKLQQQTFIFLRLMINRKREIHLLETCNQVIKIYREINHIVAAKFITATQVDDKILSKVKEVIKRITDKKIEITNQVNPDIIGGFVLQVEDRQIDESISSKFSLLKRELLSNHYESKL